MTFAKHSLDIENDIYVITSVTLQVQDSFLTRHHLRKRLTVSTDGHHPPGVRGNLRVLPSARVLVVQKHLLRALSFTKLRRPPAY